MGLDFTKSRRIGTISAAIYHKERWWQKKLTNRYGKMTQEHKRLFEIVREIYNRQWIERTREEGLWL